MRTKPTIGQQFKSGLSHAMGWLLGIAWFGLVLWGMLEAFGTDANFSEGRHPSRILGYLLLGVASAVFVVTADRWKRIFPGIMCSAMLGAVLELWHGHALNNSSVSIPRWIALVQLAVIAGVTLLSFTFKTRTLKVADRIALLIFSVSIFAGGKQATEQRFPFALVVGGACVLAAWAYDRLQRRTERHLAA